MKTKQDYRNEVELAKRALEAAETALLEFEDQAENNVFETMPQAEYEIEKSLMRLARDACEGSGNCGLDEYRRKFMIGSNTYEGVLTLEYDRHDKQYYYVENSEFVVRAL